jgi:hypothetical protein
MVQAVWSQMISILEYPMCFAQVSCGEDGGELFFDINLVDLKVIVGGDCKGNGWPNA